MKKYLYSFLRFFLIYSVGFVAFYLFNYIFARLNEYLAVYLPRFFKVYNPIIDNAAMLRQEAVIALLAAVASVVLLTVIAVRTDNLKYEYMISRTDGFYRVREGAEIYFPEFLGADILSAVSVPLISYPLTLIDVPNSAPRALRVIENILDTVLVIPEAFEGMLGAVLGAALLVLTSLIARAYAAFRALFFWRAAWLSSAER